MALTAAELAEAQDRAVRAVRDLYSHQPEDDHADTCLASGIARDREARDRVTYAVTHDVSHRQIARLVGVSGIAVARLIDDRDAHGEALRYERHAAEQYLREVLLTIRTAAVRQVTLEVPKSTVARRFGVARSVLDGWLAGER